MYEIVKNRKKHVAFNLFLYRANEWPLRRHDVKKSMVGSWHTSSFLNHTRLPSTALGSSNGVLNFCSKIWEFMRNIVTLISQHQINLLTNAQSQ